MKPTYIYRLLYDFISFPNAHICKHYVCIEILNVLQDYVNVDPELISTINNADDKKALELLSDLFT